MKIKNPMKIAEKDWGWEYWIKVTDKYAFKVLEIYKDKQLSHHYHKYKEETWLVLKGKGKLTLDERSQYFEEGDIVHIKPNVKHKLIPDGCDVTLIEASTNEMWDSIRVVK